MSATPTHVCFDFDGTLVDTFHLALRKYAEIAPRLGCPIVGEHHIEMLRSSHARDIVRTLNIPFYKIPRLATQLRAAVGQEILSLDPVEGIVSVIAKLGEYGYHLGIVSSNAETNVRRFLNHHRIDGFQRYLCGSTVFGKARLLRRYARDEGIALDRLLYIGDELRDAEASRRVGAHFGAVAWGYTNADALLASRPDHFFSRPTDIVRALVGEGGLEDAPANTHINA